MIRIFTLISLSFSIFSLRAQFLETLPVTYQLEEGNLRDRLDDLSKNLGIKIVIMDTTIVLDRSRQYQNQVLPEVLSDLLQETPLSYLFYRDYLVLIADRDLLHEARSVTFYQALQESVDASANSDDQTEMVVGSLDNVIASGVTTVSGVITDSENGEEIIGATLLIRETGLGTDTDESGAFNLSLKPGSYNLQLQYIGYRERLIPIRVISSGVLDLELSKSSILLDEVVVEAKKRDENIQSSQVGVSRITIHEIERLPSFLGEVDIIKGVLQQPGVSTIGEGSSGFNVRGGTVDQNLILMDEGMIFNASHALGFFSSFNSDILSDAVLHKGNMPGKYGGRLASVLDVNLREGNFEKLRFKGGLGVVSSRLTLEGPIKENKTSFLIAGRSTYSNWILKSIKVPEVSTSSAFFYDANAKLTHRINERNFISLSAYATADEFIYAEQFGFDYQTLMGQLNYTSAFGDHILSTFSVIYSDYVSNQYDLEGTNESKLNIGTRYLKLKENVNYNRDRLNIDAGISMIQYQVNTGQLDPMGEISVVIPRSVAEETGRESAIYTDAAVTINPRWTVTAGLRFTLYQFLGPREMFTYEDPENPASEGITGTQLFQDKVIHDETLLQPRISARFLIDATSSLKGGYARTSQYINQISNNDTPTPTNLWQLTNQYIPSQLSHNFSLGYFRNFRENIWNTSFEVYYRSIDRLIDYRDFADLIANNHLETEILDGVGKTYGIELGLKKQVGTLHGWLNYTYSRSLRKIEGISRDQWYPSNFDKPHDLSLVTNFQINKRNTISVNFSYSTGRAITIPIDRHGVEGQFVVLNYSDRNAFRAPDYHRLDFAYTLGQGFRKSRKFKTSWTFSVYNVYARRNAFSVFVVQESFADPKIKRLAILGNAFPSLTFNFELL